MLVGLSFNYSDAIQFVAMKHTHWTFTPDFPYNKSVTEQ